MPSHYLANDWLASHHTCCNCGGKFISGLHKATHSRKHHGRYMHANCFDAKRQTADHAAGITQPEPIQPAAEVQPASAPVTASAADGNAMAVLAAAIAPYIKVDSAAVDAMVQQMQDAIESFDVKTTETLAEARETMQSLVAAEVAKATRTLTITLPDAEPIKIDNAHVSMDELAEYVLQGDHCYLYGGPGSGKSHAVRQLAEALGIPFGYISLNPQTAPSQVVGYMDQSGNYVKTTFAKMYAETGGIFCFDEADNANDMVLTSLNSALANDLGAFPCGNLERHPKFVCICTGNTDGNGATTAFPTRRKLDIAFRDRFTFLNWDYDTKLERELARAFNADAGAWVDWCIAARTYCSQQKGTALEKLFITPRASIKGAKYLKTTSKSVRAIADAVAFKGFAEADVKRLLAAIPLPEYER